MINAKTKREGGDPENDSMDAKAFLADYGDAAIFVVSRICGEGADIPWYGAGDGNGNLLELSYEEQELLGRLADMKASGDLSKIVVLLNVANAVELDFLNPEVCGRDYGVDACLWVGEVGQSGINAIGDLLNGSINPSGKLVDTYSPCFFNLARIAPFVRSWILAISDIFILE